MIKEIMTMKIRFMCMMIDDTWFYWSHRLLHESKWLYAKVHKHHHLHHKPTAACTEDAHWVEDVFCSTIATVLGPLWLGAHFQVWVLYIVIRLTQSVDAHSGYNLPWYLSPWSVLPFMDSAPMHDFHHSNNKGCYGGFFSIWDRVCGTHGDYERWAAEQRQEAKDRGQSEPLWLR